MSELSDVLRALDALSARGERHALATVVAVRGSTYRRPGARLVIPEDGDVVGNISGGCLEGAVVEEARLVIREGRPRLVAIDLTADDDAVWGLGLGCNGAIEVWIEPGRQAAEVAQAIRIALELERPVAVVTVIESTVPDVREGARILLRSEGPEAETEAGTEAGSLGEETLDIEAREAAASLLGAGGAEARLLPGSRGQVRAFVEALEPPPRLLVCGAGADAIPMVSGAGMLGWRTTVVDDRPGLATRLRFPEAVGLIDLERDEDAAKATGVDDRTFVIVMTHSFARDKEYLRSLLASPAPYIGMLGPLARTERILTELESEGTTVGDAERARIHAPAGLDIGGEGPEEIAQSILAEILAVRRGRRAGFLRDRLGSIHDRPSTDSRVG